MSLPEFLPVFPACVPSCHPKVSVDDVTYYSVDYVTYYLVKLITDRGTIYREYHCDHPGDSLADPWPWWR